MRRIRILEIALALVVVLGTASEGIAITLLPGQERRLDVKVEADGLVDSQQFVDLTSSESRDQVIGADVGSTNRASVQAVLSTFSSSSILTGGGGAGGGIIGNGTIADGASWVQYRFRVQGCERYSLYSTLGGDGDHNTGSAAFHLATYDLQTLDRVGLVEDTVLGGGPPSVTTSEGQLSDGTYSVDGLSELGPVQGQGDYSAPVNSWAMNFSPCLYSLIDQQPTGGAFSLGQTAVFSVTSGAGAAADGGSGGSAVSASGASSLTYQWHHEGSAVLDDGRISGATTSTLTITGIQVSDAGGYVVRVSDGVTEQISSLAVLSLPEPGGAAMVVSGAIALLWVGRRRSRRFPT